MAKRLIDILVSATALIVLSPIYAIVALAICVGMGWPPLFTQTRPGLQGRLFSIYKFRTMTRAVDARGQLLPDDVRLTALGRFLRRTSLDELPELINVLKGDMSIVGPRPHAAAAKAGDSLYWEVDARYWARHCIKPGMTGLAQVRGHRGSTDHHQDLIDRLQSDLEYVSDWSIWRDLRIIVATLGVLVHHKAY